IGLPFFFTGSALDAQVDVYGPYGESGLQAGVDAVVGPPGFPINTDGLAGEWRFHDLTDDQFQLRSLHVTSRHIRHRGPTLGFRIEGFGATLAYLSDHGPSAEGRGREQDD